MNNETGVIDVTRILWWDRFISRRLGDLVMIGWFTIAATAAVSRAVDGVDITTAGPLVIATSGFTVAVWAAIGIFLKLSLGRKMLSFSALLRPTLLYAAMVVSTSFATTTVVIDAFIVTLIVSGVASVIDLRRHWLLRISVPRGAA